MIPVNATASMALTQSLNNARRDNAGFERVSTLATVVENEAEANRKREEAVKFVAKMEEAQAKPRDEDHVPRNEEHPDEQKKGGLTDIYV